MTRCTECIVAGHRGFKAKYTENTITGFTKCYETGATMFETDTWTTLDEVLVISHDVNTKRIFCNENGEEADYNILQSYFSQLKNLRTIESGEPILTFKALLQWFFDYVKEHGGADSDHRIMLDIKNANPPKILQLIVRDLLEVHLDLEWWFPRVQLGVWNLRFVKYLNQDPYFQKVLGPTKPHNGFSQFDVLHISASWQDSMTYMAYNEYVESLPEPRFKVYVTGVSLIYISTWCTDFVTVFLPAARKQNLKLFSWTVNTVAQLDYFCHLCMVARIREYGVISDWPDKMIQFLGRIESGAKEEKQALVPRVHIPFMFRVSNFFFRGFLYFSGVRALAANPHQFGTRVDPSEVVVFRARLSQRIFAFLQHRRIF